MAKSCAITLVIALLTACGGSNATTDVGPESGSDVTMTDSATDVATDTASTDASDATPPDTSPSDAIVADTPSDTPTCPATPSGMPHALTINFSNSCPFTACGGDPTGVWRYQSICAADPSGPIRSMCPGATATAMGTTMGTVTLMGGFASRDITVHADVNATIPASCALVGCMTIQSALVMAGYADATCSASGVGGCMCHFTQNYHVMDCDTYTVSGTQIVTGHGVTYDFCVNGLTLTYRETGSMPREPWVATLGH